MTLLTATGLRLLLEDDARRLVDELLGANGTVDAQEIAGRVLLQHQDRAEVRNRLAFLWKHVEEYIAGYVDRQLRPPAGAERRRHPRLELNAAVMIRDAANLVLPVRNISLGGVFLLSEGNDLTRLAPKAWLDLVVFHPRKEELRVAVSAQVVRHRDVGIALTWNPDAILEIAAFVETVRDLRAEP